MRFVPFALAFAIPAAAAAQPVPELPDFDPATFAAPASNPYWPLEPGAIHVIATPDGDEKSRIEVLGPGPVILGVQTTQVLDEAWEEGRIVERTYDYFAADGDGTVWYFGEDVTNFRYDEDGTLTGTDDASAWRAGVNGAAPGIVMPAEPAPAGPVFQEHAPREAAMDFASVDAVGLTLRTPLGPLTGVIRTREGSTVEADAREFKYYAPGVGLVRVEEDLDVAWANPETVFEIID